MSSLSTADKSTGPFHLLGMRIDTLDPEAGLARIARRAAAGLGGYCCIGNVHQCMLVRDDPAFAKVINGADLVMTDSRILHRFIARDNRMAMMPTMRGAEMMLDLCRRAEVDGTPIALVGAPDADWLARLEARLIDTFPELRLAYRFSPPTTGMTDTEEDAMLDALNASGARLVLVGLGCPKQERWMARHTASLPHAMLVGVGAAFDFNSGRVRKSPPWVHAAGLEWAYRMFAEPRRLARRYLSSSPRFLLAYAFRTRRSRSGAA